MFPNQNKLERSWWLYSSSTELSYQSVAVRYENRIKHVSKLKTYYTTPNKNKNPNLSITMPGLGNMQNVRITPYQVDSI